VERTIRKVPWVTGDPPKVQEHFNAALYDALNRRFFERYELTTAGTGTLTEIWSETLPTNAVWHVEYVVIGRGTSAAARAVYRAEACVYREAGGSATFEGAVSTSLSRESVAGFNHDLSVSSNDVVLKVRDDGVITVDWQAYVYVLELRA